MLNQLAKVKVALIATDGVEESELLVPRKALEEAGAQVDLLSLKEGEIQCFKHHDKSVRVRVDRLISEAQPGEYDALLLPGGALSADALRVEPRVQSFVRVMHSVSKPIAFICHAPWLLISADVVRGRKLTSYHTIRDDIRNAGGEWSDQEVVVDNNWVSSRSPADLEAFNREMLRLFALRAPSGYRSIAA